MKGDMKMKTITVTNQKGGVGKTATVLNLASELSRRGYSVLAIDLDPQQGNLSQTLHADKGLESMYEVICGDADLADVIQHTKFFDIATATVDMSNIDDKLNSNGGVGRERRLKKAIASLPEGSYDFIILDTPPALNLLTTNALVAADAVLVVTESDVNAMHGMKQLKEMVDSVKEYYNPSVGYAGVLLSKFNERTNIGKMMQDICGQLADVMKTDVFKTTIRASVIVPESIVAGTDVYTRDPNAGVTRDYNAFATELLVKIGEVA